MASKSGRRKSGRGARSRGAAPTSSPRRNQVGASTSAQADRHDSVTSARDRMPARRTLFDLLLLAVSALLFTFSFPHFLSDAGWWPLAYVAIAPAVYVVNKSGLLRAALYGLVYGLVSYMLHNYWIGSFHVLAILIVPLIYGVYYVVLFPLLQLAKRFFPRNGYLVQTAIWVGYEYLRTLGFLGYAYGILGYSQYRIPALVRFSSVPGVLGVSLLVVLPSMLLATIFLSVKVDDLSGTVRQAFLRYRIDFGAYAVALAAALLVGGVVLRTDYSGSRNWRVALVQQNVDPHQGGLAAYEESLRRSIRQSEAALAEDDSIETVIWSETSFVPPIGYHSQFRENPDTLALVNRIRAFMAEQTVPYIIGNSDARRERQEDGTVSRVDYNATLLFEEGEIVETYRKVHLVPFTENFPYDGMLFGWMRDILLEFDTHFWGEGTEYTVFETSDGVRFSTPICFEDTFGYLSREFVREGAEVIVNLTNDRWANSVSAAMQHFAMSVFRAGENRRTMVRGTNGGITAVVDPNGVITAIDEPLVESYLIADAPVYTDSQTVYTRFGDWFAVIVLAGAAIAMIFGAVRDGRRR